MSDISLCLYALNLLQLGVMIIARQSLSMSIMGKIIIRQRNLTEKWNPVLPQMPNAAPYHFHFYQSLVSYQDKLIWQKTCS